jgi:hypothetical protein
MNEAMRRKYVPESFKRTKIGDSEVKLTREMLKDIRDKMKSFDQSWPILRQAEEISKGYPGSSPATIETYVYACRVHDEVFDLYMAETISFGVLREVCTLDNDTGKFLVEEMIERKLLPSHIQGAKSIMKQGIAKTWDDALRKASGENKAPLLTPDERRVKSKPQRSEAQNFDELVKDVLFSGTEWRIKTKALIGMLPMASEGAIHSFQTFTKLYMTREFLMEQLKFVDETVKGVLDRMTPKASVEADFTEVRDVQSDGGNRTEVGESGGEGQEGEDRKLHDSGQVVPHPPDEEEDH